MTLTVTRKWVRLKELHHCGSCGQPILIGAPVCLLMPDTLKHPLLRCETCVGPAPDEFKETCP